MALSGTSVLATPTPSPAHLEGRAPADVTVNTPPQTTITCGGTKTYDTAYLQEAVRWAADFKARDLLQDTGTGLALEMPTSPVRTCYALNDWEKSALKLTKGQS
ncbi:MAG: hypothetical protein Q9213_002331 [Squamulea squamosa]